MRIKTNKLVGGKYVYCGGCPSAKKTLRRSVRSKLKETLNSEIKKILDF